jgi:hypothetical protein
MMRNRLGQMALSQFLNGPVALGLQLAIIFVVWFICGTVAGVIAPDRNNLFFWLTFLLLGPLGVAAALIAQPVEQPSRAVAAGRQRFTCPRCGAENDIPDSDRSYDCWRCPEHRSVRPANRTMKSSAEAATPVSKANTAKLD